MPEQQRDDRPLADRLTAFQKSLGITWAPTEGGEPSDARGSVQMEIRDDLRGPAGSLEGGAIATLIDVSAASCAAFHYGPSVVTQQIVTNYLSAALVGPVAAEASPVRIGRSVGVIEVRLYDRGRTTS